MSRPETAISKSDFEKLCALHCTEEEIAGFFDCSPDTVYRWCEKQYGMGFAEVYRTKSVVGNVSLRRAQWEEAVNSRNTTLLVWLGKQLLGQKDISRIELTEISDDVFAQEAERRLKLVTSTSENRELPQGQKTIDKVQS